MKTTMTKTSMILSATALTAIMMLASCAKESDLDTIKDAQMCLNKATTATAQACVSKLSAMTSDQANQLKCAAYFIQEGFGSPTTLLNAISTANTGNSSSTVNIISQLSFSSQTNSDAAYSVCNSSGIAVYSQLSSLVQISTLVKTASATATTGSDYATVINALPAATLGALVQTTYTSSCSSSSGSGEALQEYCGQLGEALASNSASAVGACLKYKLAGGANPGNGCPNN
ncbi:hypothetical protein CIK05_01595 [Bdellovibrio sp. qaytius]|nr:hypothetical protein CIK05_01595 [Bdellovibrio sp. qaytius]